MIKRLRMGSQQLVAPRFDTPGELVSWMGAIQGQDYVMSQWAVGLRLRQPSLSVVQEALRKGEIIRTHIMRPTWHLVSAEDIRWMLPLTALRLRKANESYGRGLGINEKSFLRGNDLLQKMLEGGLSLTKAEIVVKLTEAGVLADSSHINMFLFRAETDALICSGPDRGNKVTYALFDERVPAQPAVSREEALARLAERYFRSHSPATLQDFSWWSGLNLTEAREAIALISDRLVTDRFAPQELYVHEWCREVKTEDDPVHLMPSYDEYLISYKDRTAVLDLKHQRQAYNSYGIFYPVMLYQGRIVGNWKREKKGKEIQITHTLFAGEPKPKAAEIRKAVGRYLDFLGK
ncbi:MAG: winged helix DNA-binding domain-containing protein [Bacteroides sp.]|nr:winged helix DNA-binding domain-containing protein [Bacteroides sp.]